MDRNPEQGLYFISIAASLAEVHPQTLRMYERRGLLRPDRTSKNRRRYSDADIARLQRIQELTQDQGLNLSGVRMVLEMEDEIAALRARVSDLERELLETRRMLEEEPARAKRLVALSRRAPGTLLPAVFRKPGASRTSRD